MELTDRIEEQREGQVGSIGGTEIMYGHLNQRVKGFAGETEPMIVEGDFTARRLQGYIDQARFIAQAEDATRISVRTITTDMRLLQDIRGAEIEAVIPFTFDGVELFMTYLGRNDSRRLTPGILFQEQSDTYQQIISRSPRTDQVEISSEYDLQCLSNPTNQDVNEAITLMGEAYSRNGELIMWYEPTFDNVKTVLQDSVTYVARHEGRIVSMAAAERADINIFGNPLIMYELSDCATLPEHRRQGLVQACTQGVMEDLHDAHIIYNESRVAHTPIVRAMRNMGFVGDGILRNHVRIGGDRDLPEISDIESLAVMYIPRCGR